MTVAGILMVAAGGFFGAIARYSLSKSLNARGTALPLGTLLVNLLGALLLGFITGIHAPRYAALLFGTGFMGAFTTFSTLKLEMIGLHLKKFKKEFILYTSITYGGGILLAYLGYLAGDLIR
ncbi:CrcB family protein [Peribacillus kribbensis]|uniref:CrcB family protein n=1 Tax=Peribacillus kribbensis TaxID=356658 RepID=UPI00041B840F|nr:CrcB family protein [Peribacillus kribbensis]